MRQKPHVRICGGLGRAISLVYPTSQRRHRTHTVLERDRDDVRALSGWRGTPRCDRQ
jgi:hypothetical protein